MAAIGLDHVQLAMPSGGEETARSFYIGLLGLVERAKPPVLAARGGCWFAVPGSTSDVGEVHLGVEDPFVSARKAHPGLLVDDLDALVDTLSQQGFPYIPDDNIPGLRRGHTADPFGNRIELIET
jgi:catechol 2,3-dioxygenase-like lactoylglutathione lyase family enzyme